MKDQKMNKDNSEFLYKAILSLETLDECRSFFEDLCTIPEIKAMSQRLFVAKMLVDRQVYSDIVEETGASTATISRVNRSLVYGNNSYNTVFDRLFSKE